MEMSVYCHSTVTSGSNASVLNAETY